MKAEAGRLNPAITSNNEVLPPPDGPKTVVTLWFASRSSSSRNEAKWAMTFLRTSPISDLSVSQQPGAAPNCSERQSRGNSQQNKRMLILAQLNGLKNCQ